VPIYARAITFLYRLHFAEKLGQPKTTEAEIMEFAAASIRDFTIWASPEVLVQFERFKSPKAGSSPREVLFPFEDLLFAMRKDLGHSDGFRLPESRAALKRRDLLRLFVNGIDSYLGGAT